MRSVCRKHNPKIDQRVRDPINRLPRNVHRDGPGSCSYSCAAVAAAACTQQIHTPKPTQQESSGADRTPPASIKAPAHPTILAWKEGAGRAWNGPRAFLTFWCVQRGGPSRVSVARLQKTLLLRALVGIPRAFFFLRRRRVSAVCCVSPSALLFLFWVMPAGLSIDRRRAHAPLAWRRSNRIGIEASPGCWGRCGRSWRPLAQTKTAILLWRPLLPGCVFCGVELFVGAGARRPACHPSPPHTAAAHPQPRCGGRWLAGWRTGVGGGAGGRPRAFGVMTAEEEGRHLRSEN